MTTTEKSLDGKNTTIDYNTKGSDLTISGVKTESSNYVAPTGVRIAGANEMLPVTAIGAKAMKGQSLESATLPKNIAKVDKKAFESCGLTELVIEGGVSKKMFAKDSLKGNGTGKKGKGLTITVESKKDAKVLKKQLARAGAKKAKVVVVAE
ncbi:MAG TPA: hypothetical protein DCL38_07935 [Lachnospiraceae bacterium]|nr:hypothetical protein [Lachnospiraceae bacterium]